MDVKLTKKCGRCEREEEVVVSLEVAAQMEAAAKVQAEKGEKLQAQIQQLLVETYPDGGGPDVVVVLQHEGQYHIKQLSNLCSIPDAKRNRGCKARVATLFQDMFMLLEKKPVTRKPKAVESEAPEEAAPEEEPARPQVQRNVRR